MFNHLPKLTILSTLLLLTCSSTIPNPSFIPEPPTWPQYFQQSFDESYTSTTVRTTGKVFYNSVSSKMRIDRVNGHQDSFCGSVLPGLATSCSIVFRDDKKFIYYPEQRICCFCCDSSHGCSMPPPTFLTQSTFIGTQNIGSESVNKWMFINGQNEDFYYDTVNSRVPRRFQHKNGTTSDFIVNSFSKTMPADTVFVIPTYCQNQCPANTLCGRYRLGEMKIQ